MKIYFYTNVIEKERTLKEIYKNRIKLYYTIMESPKPIRNVGNILFGMFCGTRK